MDHILNNLKNYKDLAEKKSIYYNDIDKALIIVQEYIKQNKLIIYGGLAIDIALKLIGHPGIYQDDVIPDYDVYSCDFYNDSNKLAMILYEKKLLNVSSINALHFNSRRVRVNFQSVCDFSYIPSEIFKKIPYIEINSKNANIKKYNGLRIIHPDFQRLDLHRAYNIPYANAPQEVILHRLEKDAKRFRMLNERYPLPDEHIKITGHKNITVKINKDSIYSGLVAYAIIYSQLINKLKIPEILQALNDTGLMQFVTDQLKKVIVIEWENNEIKCPIELNKICYITELTDKFKDIGELYFKYLDNLRPEMSIKDNHELFNITGEMVPYYQVDDIKIAASNGVLLYLLQKYFETDNKQYASLYNSFLNIMTAAEKIVIALEEKNNDYLLKNYNDLPFFLPGTAYGKTAMEADIPRPPFGFYPAKSTDWPKFQLTEHYNLTGYKK